MQAAKTKTMKQYDREKKEWVTDEEMQRRLGKRKACKAGKTHEYAVVLPPYVRITPNTVTALDVVQQYYELQEKHRLQCVEQDIELEKLGVQLSYSSSQIKTLVHRRCILCGKKDLQAYTK